MNFWKNGANTKNNYFSQKKSDLIYLYKENLLEIDLRSVDLYFKMIG